jgi:hypothetical protein
MYSHQATGLGRRRRRRNAFKKREMHYKSPFLGRPQSACSAVLVLALRLPFD